MLLSREPSLLNTRHSYRVLFLYPRIARVSIFASSGTRNRALLVEWFVVPHRPQTSIRLRFGLSLVTRIPSGSHLLQPENCLHNIFSASHDRSLERNRTSGTGSQKCHAPQEAFIPDEPLGTGKTNIKLYLRLQKRCSTGRSQCG